jgi:hypothetical protein
MLMQNRKKAGIVEVVRCHACHQIVPVILSLDQLRVIGDHNVSSPGRSANRQCDSTGNSLE